VDIKDVRDVRICKKKNRCIIFSLHHLFQKRSSDAIIISRIIDIILDDDVKVKKNLEDFEKLKKNAIENWDKIPDIHRIS
jgi:ABC-type Na+ transport system ATPase subunit NatA